MTTRVIAFELTETGWEAARAAEQATQPIGYTLTDLGWGAADDPEEQP